MKQDSKRGDNLERVTIRPISFPRDCLSEVARKDRRCLLLFSTLALAIGLANIVPSEIPVLGIEFELSEQQLLLQILGAIVVYFVLAFLSYSVHDLLTFWSMHKARLQEFKIRQLEYEKRLTELEDSDRELFNSQMAELSTEELEQQIRELESKRKEFQQEASPRSSQIKEELQVFLTEKYSRQASALRRDFAEEGRLFGWAARTSVLRLFVDFVIPLVVGAYAIWVIFCKVRT